MSKNSPVFAHVRDILILPFSVTCIIPYLIYDQHNRLPETIFFYIIGVILGCCGVVLFFYTVFLFKTIGKGTLAPWSEKQKLVIEGPYRYCRNPMITGVLFILVGEAFFFHSVNIFVWTTVFFTINTVYFLISEEPALYKRFGEEYKQYKMHVPRWIPALRPYRPK
jgi:protein-S-isoprenylcysteine O-methyltransferase Ste14